MPSHSSTGAQNVKEAMRKKSLGELGELFAIKTLVDNEFDKIRNLNDEHMNEPFADFFCEKNGARYVISVKTRNMYQLNGRINNRYNLGENAYEKARAAEQKYSGIAYWMAIQFDSHEYSVFLALLSALISRRQFRLIVVREVKSESKWLTGSATTSTSTFTRTLYVGI